ncbi:Proline-rich protein 1 [Cardamine amara subsp. amara]|uniref:Proline-rich protein 1 n=1 Tax=Cardamine amara subsp. amara TaxID=228776 RepID=A0ABD0ZT84_CARAN
MAITRASFAICLLLSLATIATADYYSPSSPPVYKSPTFPPPVYTPPVYKPTLSPPVYTKPTIPPPVYTPPVYNPTLPPPVYKKSPSYSPPPPPYVPKPTYTAPTKPYVPEILITAVDGIILCKNGYKTYPIQGAKAKIVCSEPGSYGKSKNEVVIYSDPTDSKGYFHVTLTDIIKDLLHCRVMLYTSPVETCNNPTNISKGLTGIPLSMYGYRYYADKNLKLFSVGPFYYTGPKAAPATPKY